VTGGFATQWFCNSKRFINLILPRSAPNLVLNSTVCTPCSPLLAYIEKLISFYTQFIMIDPPTDQAKIARFFFPNFFNMTT
jgi:hypothetical protein